MKKIFLLTAFALCFGFSGCSEADSGCVSVKSPDGKFSVTLPKDMHKIKNSNSAATMQYYNSNNELSFMVTENEAEDYKKFIDQNISDFKLMRCFDSAKTADIYGLDGFEFLMVQHHKSSTQDFTLQAETDTVINGVEAKIIEYNGKIEGEKSYVILCLYKCSDKYYELYSMTSHRKIADYKKTMLDMVKSLEFE